MGFSLALLLAYALASEPTLAPPGALEMPVRAVDHVAVAETVEEGTVCVGCGPYRRTIFRSGPWVREDRVYADRSQSAYSDFASGTTFMVERDAAGVARSLSVERLRAASESRMLRRERTGARGDALGEVCEVWTIGGFYHRQESCETSDGVQLWSRDLYSNGTVYRSTRIVSLERRPVAAQEVRPPAQFFRLVSHPAVAAPAPNSPSFEVRLAATGSDEVREEVLRARGNLGGGYRIYDDGARFGWGHDGALEFSYRIEAERPVRLLIQPVEWGLARVGLARAQVLRDRWKPVPGRRPRRVLGETCTWQQDSAIRSTDVRHQCRTTDGIPLMIHIDWHSDSRDSLYRARSFSRRPPDLSAFQVPAEAMDWATWGVEPPPAPSLPGG
jgi:hypothetical protein